MAMTDSPNLPKYNFLTWNVRGLGDQRKCRHILAYLDRHNIHCALLQETPRTLCSDFLCIQMGHLSLLLLLLHICTRHRYLN